MYNTYVHIFIYTDSTHVQTQKASSDPKGIVTQYLGKMCVCVCVCVFAYTHTHTHTYISYISYT